MNCVGCQNRYVGKGWICWSGNKKSLSKCDDGKPKKGRVIYKGMETKKSQVEEVDNGT